MTKDDHMIRLHSIISRTILTVQTSDEILTLSRSIGIPDGRYVDFIMGLMYCSTQTSFRKESGLSEKEADSIFLEFWKKEGRDIRTRLIQMIEKREKPE